MTIIKPTNCLAIKQITVFPLFKKEQTIYGTTQLVVYLHSTGSTTITLVLS